jgi:hypothetical protein
MAIRFARWDPPSFGCRLRNSSAQAHATDRNPYCLENEQPEIQADNSRLQADWRSGRGVDAVVPGD